MFSRHLINSLAQNIHLGVKDGGETCYFGDICPKMRPNVRGKLTFLLYIIQLHLDDIVIYIFKTSDKLPGPKHPFRGQRRGSDMLFWGCLHPNASLLVWKAKKNLLYIRQPGLHDNSNLYFENI